MGAFSKLRDTFRDKTRDKLCAGLCAIGVDARMVEQGRPEEDIGGGKRENSLGLIEIHGEPIHWVNVVREQRQAVHGWGYLAYKYIYLVPDPSVCTRGCLVAKSIRVKSVPVFGRWVDILWKGNLEVSLTRRMNEDVLLKQRLIGLKEQIEIRSFPESGCWAIWSNRYESFRVAKWQPPPSPAQWDCYKTIARHLLEPGMK